MHAGLGRLARPYCRRPYELRAAGGGIRAARLDSSYYRQVSDSGYQKVTYGLEILPIRPFFT